MMEQAAEDQRGQRAMECGGSGVGDGGNDKGGDSSSNESGAGGHKDGGKGCSKCNGNSRGDRDGQDHDCNEGKGVGNTAMPAVATAKAAVTTEGKVMATAWLQK
jgi:hypothetical protein